MDFRFLISGLILFTLCSVSTAQKRGIGVPYFSTDLEAYHFDQLQKSDSNAIEVYMAFAENFDEEALNARKRIDIFINELAKEKLSANHEKKLKKIYQKIHDTFLQKYELNITFDRIFIDGWYNCVTACALYGIIFDRLNIPFVIKETPTHVYIIAYPQTEQILIETTDPMGGFKTFSPGFKEDFVVRLASLKLIDQKEAGTGVNNIFNTYYFTKANLGLKQLAGIHYYNHGISHLEKNEFLEASWDLEKANILHSDDDQITQMYVASLAMTVSNSNYPTLDHVYALAKLSMFIGRYNVAANNIVGEFGRFLVSNLTNRNDTLMCRTAFEILMAATLDEVVHHEVGRTYNYERSRLAYNRGRFEEAFIYARRAYDAAPGNVDSENLMRASLGSMGSRGNNSLLRLTEVEKLLEEHSELRQNGYFSGILLNLYLARMGEEFDNKNLKSAYTYKVKFETFISENSGAIYDSYEVGKAYSKGSVYHFKKGQEKEARALLKKGLEFAPGNSELRSRQYMMNRN